MRKYSNRVTQYVEHDDKTKKSEEDIGSFSEHKLRYQKWIREFKAQIDFRKLDNGLVDAQANDAVLTVTIPKGSSRIYAMNLLHWSIANNMKDTYHEALLEKRMKLKSKHNKRCPEADKHC